ncbi:glycosyltransferase family 2 protein [Paenibacillus roseipurpureus]|uniref:Glycosyltransferase family 2 protein n=1 Tax=Paenibacillus roseopurpureus TaxID=2918901 RepID=A0AA96LS34_9BACL|nr:glycosyltransferase family 2 protein [Paenibacillus sp. MBLB1832]WNR46268.1 glycosyltransferase family 2 protein [Paenibacillus sp. MBLB1832]
MSTLISIVMLTWNGLNYTKECVDSILRHADKRIQIQFVFVDNGSTDGTVEYLRSVPSSKLICNQVNRGFAAGNNQGLAVADGEYICLLNNDTVVTKGWLTRLLSCLEQNPAIAIVGPRSNNVAWAQLVYNVPYKSMSEMEAFAANWSQLNRDQGFFPHKLIGHCMLFHKDLITKIGGLDERFFPGNYEDDDFCLRARVSGQILWVANDVYVHHYGGSTFKSNQTNYSASAFANAERFSRKWSLGMTGLELDQFGYNPSELVEREKPFRIERHYVPIGGKVHEDCTDKS